MQICSRAAQLPAAGRVGIACHHHAWLRMASGTLLGLKDLSSYKRTMRVCGHLPAGPLTDRQQAPAGDSSEVPDSSQPPV